jgi:hypothetical protein
MRKIYLFTFLFLISTNLIFGQSKFGAAVNIVYGFPSGVFGNTYKSNIGESASVLYHYLERMDIMFSAGYINFPFDNGKYNQSLRALNPNVNPVNLNINYQAVPVLIGAKLFLMGKKFKPFFVVEGGVSFLKFQTPTSSSSGNGNVTISDNSSVQITLDAGVGVAYSIINNLNLNLCAKLNYINEKAGQLPTLGVGNTAYLQFGNSIISFYSIDAGLSFYL